MMGNFSVGTLVVYLWGMFLSVLFGTLLRTCFYKERSNSWMEHSDENVVRHNFITRIGYIGIIILSLAPIINDILAAVLLIIFVDLCLDHDRIRDCRFTRWLFS